MKHLSSAALAGALLAALAVSLAGHAAQAMTMGPGSAMPGSGAPAARGRTPADRAFAASNAAMMKGMGVQPSGDPDRDFVAMMLPHHRGAVDMARVELRYGRDPMLRTLAVAIIAAQEKEIGRMRAWQRKHAR